MGLADTVFAQRLAGGNWTMGSVETDRNACLRRRRGVTQYRVDEGGIVEPFARRKIGDTRRARGRLADRVRGFGDAVLAAELADRRQPGAVDELVEPGRAAGG